jgi:hypothetical protein
MQIITQEQGLIFRVFNLFVFALSGTDIQSRLAAPDF